MLIILSPAKSLDYKSPLATQCYTQPELLDDAAELIKYCCQLTPAQIASLMKISDKLADLNAGRFSEWQPAFTLNNARQAILTFNGDVYTGLQAECFSEADFNFAQPHLRILSGLYGLLRPLDLIMPYRLEMGTKLPNRLGPDLYHFWRNKLTMKLQQQLEQQGDDILIQLASDEYFKAIHPATLQAQIIKPVFLDKKNGTFKVISFYAKKARGLMSRFIIQNRLHQVEQLTEFDLEGYGFSQERRSTTSIELVFTREIH